MAINGKASQKKQLNATYIMSLLVEHCKDILEPQAYEELKKRYSKTVYQQKKEKLAKEKAKIEAEKKKLALKEKELALKEKTAKSYEKQTDLSIEKTERQRLVEELIRLKQSAKTIKNIERIAEIRQKLKDTDKT